MSVQALNGSDEGGAKLPIILTDRSTNSQRYVMMSIGIVVAGAVASLFADSIVAPRVGLIDSIRFHGWIAMPFLLSVIFAVLQKSNPTRTLKIEDQQFSVSGGKALKTYRYRDIKDVRVVLWQIGGGGRGGSVTIPELIIEMNGVPLQSLKIPNFYPTNFGITAKLMMDYILDGMDRAGSDTREIRSRVALNLP